MAKTVFLNPGHGGKDPGAVAYGMKEKDINLQIMFGCKEELERHGVKVFTSKMKDENDPLAEVVREANASKADIFLSFHTNAGKGNGSETYYYGTSTEGKKLAELCEKYARELGQNAHGKQPVKKGNSLYVIKNTNMPAVLCECAFIDNDEDNDIVDTVAEQKAFGVAYAKAILEYFGIKYIAKGEPVKSEPAKAESVASKGYLVKVTTGALNIRSGAGTANKVVGVIRDKGTYTIIDTKDVNGVKWGKLKSGAGWICLNFAKKV